MSPVGLLYATGALVKGVSGNVACVVGVTLGARSEGATLGAQDGAGVGTLVGEGVMAAISSTLIPRRLW